MAIDTALVLVVAVGRAKDGGADGAGEMLNVVFAVERSDVGATQSLSALEAEQVESAKIVGLAQRVLTRGLFGDGEEFRCDNLVAVLRGRSVNALGGVSCG